MSIQWSSRDERTGSIDINEGTLVALEIKDRSLRFDSIGVASSRSRVGIVGVSSKSVASGGGQRRGSEHASLKSLAMEASDRIGIG